MARPEAEPARVVIVGGGVIGCAIAFELAGRGHSVTVVERDLPGRAATWAAAGMLSPLGESPPNSTFATLARASLTAYPRFLRDVTRETGLAVEFNAPGKLEVAFDQAEAERLHALYVDNGLSFITPATALSLEPMLKRGIVGAVDFPGDALIDTRALGHALWQACEKRGVVFHLGETVEAVRSSGAIATGVTTTTGDINATAVVIAAGAWSADIEGLPLRLPVMPVRGQMIALRCSTLPFQRLLQSERCYMIPRADGRVLVGATVERVGFDPRTTAAGLHGLLDAAIELVPALATAELNEFWTGFRPGTPDDLPILGADSSIAGLYYATGHYRNGILLAPITSRVIADLVEMKTPSFPLAEFRAERFRAVE